jgi:hypothetical protein
MRPIVIGLFAAVIAAATLPAVQAMAAPAAKVDPEMKKKGTEAAPALIKSANMDCSLADARLLGDSTDPKTKAKSTFYEIACAGGEGFIISSGAVGARPDVYSCLQTTGTNAACILPENADPKAGIGAVLAKQGSTCQVKDARAIGTATDFSESVFEVACQDGSGYVLHASYPISPNKPIKLSPCYILAMGGGTLQCTLSTKAQEDATFAGIVAKIGQPCDLKDKRAVGTTNDGSTFYEVACTNGKGYMIEVSANGAVKPGIDCVDADNIGDGCMLTNSRQAKADQAGLYSKLAQKAGYNCNVSKYAPLPANVPGHEVVELACSNRPDGAIAVFAAKQTDPSTIYDCAHSELAHYRCSFSTPDAANPSLTADLKKLGKTSCAVSGSRYVGQTKEGVGYIEVACADGNPGFLISYSPPAMAPKEATACPLAKEIAGGCQMPANTKRG